MDAPPLGGQRGGLRPSRRGQRLSPSYPTPRDQQGWMYDSSSMVLWNDGKTLGEGRRNRCDRVGLLLDLGVGSLAVYVDGERQELMVPNGIAPPVCWAVDLFMGTSARLESQPAP